MRSTVDTAEFVLWQKEGAECRSASRHHSARVGNVRETVESRPSPPRAVRIRQSCREIDGGNKSAPENSAEL
ncbi:hypothetical protein SKAU_G00046010 [Synaphobranchus kaupii]|uniref:Uncharacterized protein n=1 Tax=Synaphobranchus kaupii TaxID=118154 RepID=A0A9Q1G2G5_SYNKA|nr:hypothetical protein SKAU_G00046010 [Synaphobranchus kaupii]